MYQTKKIQPQVKITQYYLIRICQVNNWKKKQREGVV